MKQILAAAALTAVAISSPATAGVTIIAGDTTGQPTFNRTVSGSPPAALSGVGTAVRYSTTAFTVDTAGSYTLGLTSAYDNFLILYSGAFDPTSPLTNALVADDDSGIDLNALFSANLSAGVSYFAVATSFSNSDFGAFTLTIDGPGNIILDSAVPEPGTWALLILGFGLVGAALRRKPRVSVSFA